MPGIGGIGATGGEVAAGDFSRTGIGGSPGIGRSGSFHHRPFFRTALATNSFTISGVTRDAVGVALGLCTVDLFRTTDNSYLQTTVSDGSGNYSFTLWENAGPYYCVAYLTGSPDVAGTTANTIKAT